MATLYCYSKILYQSIISAILDKQSHPPLQGRRNRCGSIHTSELCTINDTRYLREQVKGYARRLTRLHADVLCLYTYLS